MDFFVDYSHKIPKQLKEVENWNMINSFALRLGYGLFTISLLTRLSKWDESLESSAFPIFGKSLFGIDLFNIITFLITFILLLVMAISSIIEIKEQPIKGWMTASHIKYPRIHIPIAIFFLYLATLWVQLYFRYYGLIFLIISILLVEWYYYKKKRMYCEILNKINKIK